VTTRLALIGAGLIGRRHAALLLADPALSLAAVVDPAPDAKAWAEELGVPWHPSLDSLLTGPRPQGAIVATPNRLHVPQALALVEAGIPVLVEKPIADSVEDAERLVAAAEQSGVPLLVGHHRRHNPIIAAAKGAIGAGRLGRIVAVHAMCWLAKPPSYFEADWRRAPGAGPVLINLIHDIDLLRHLCGDITAVQAMASRAVRGNPVEETASVLLRFSSGALGTMTVSDTVAAPWSWEFTSGENPAYTRTGESCYLLGGTAASLGLPDLHLWRHETSPDWWQPLLSEALAAPAQDPLLRQLHHFADVIHGRAAPLVSGRDGLEALRVVAQIHAASA
jgi:predicted dehydrogenase